jgi:hypothetical protein
MQKIPSKRLISFDLLRGFFILVIIIDHLQRWPGISDWLTGQGRLWVSAAEGFILISGIMIGLIRCYKDSSLPIIVVAKKLWTRAFILYVWSIITSALILGLTMVWKVEYSPFPPGTDSINNPGDFFGALLQFINLSAVFGWANFLVLYAVFLAFSPLAILLLRRGQWLVLLSASVFIWLVGLGKDNMFLSWQILFFGGSIFGYYYHDLNIKWSKLKNKKLIKRTIFYTSAFLLAVSAAITFGWRFIESDISPISKPDFLQFRLYLDPFFNKVELYPPRLLVAGIVFLGLFMLFTSYQKEIYKYAGWLLLPFGRHSLFVYILQSIVVVFVAGLFAESSNILVNFLITICTVLAIWLLTAKVKWLHKIIPS